MVKPLLLGTDEHEVREQKEGWAFVSLQVVASSENLQQEGDDGNMIGGLNVCLSILTRWRFFRLLTFDCRKRWCACYGSGGDSCGNRRP